MLFEIDAFDNHEHVSFFSDQATGLKAIVAIHNSQPQRAVGGVRFKHYDHMEEAVRDALRLSRAMTYKMALAGIPLGGGKTVIIGDPARLKTRALLLAFGRCLNRLGDRYFCGPDVGTSSEDMKTIAEVSYSARGLPDVTGGISDATARGVFEGIRAVAQAKLGRNSLTGLRVAVQGIGNVGRILCHLLHEAGAHIVVADLSDTALAALSSEIPCVIMPVDKITFADVDIYAPCALGGVLNEASIPHIRAQAICGAANNQLDHPEAAHLLSKRGILYAPDFVVNAGGVIMGCQLDCGYSEAKANQMIAAIYDTCMDIFNEAEKAEISTAAVADQHAREIIARRSVTA